MLELFLTTLIILVFLVGFIYLFGTFKIIHIFLYACQLIFAIVLLAKTLYKKHVLMDDLITHVHNKTFSALTSLAISGNGEYLQMNSEENSSYSIIKDSDYFNECIENYFISRSECTIKKIIIENEKKDEYKNEGYKDLKINDNKYLYYLTKKKNDGKLYKYYKDKIEISNLYFESNFNFSTINRTKRVDEDRENNSFSNFKNFIYFGDIIILIVIIQYIFNIFIEPYDNRKFDFNKYFNITIELVIFIFYIIRYIKFVKFKNFLLDNENIYKDKAFFEIYDIKKEYYFPNKVFNLDSFPVSISLNILLIRIIYFIFPQKFHYYFKEENNYCLFDNEIGLYIYYIIKSKVICLLFLFYLSVAEGSYFGYNNNLMYNWNSNPIKSIELSPTKNYEIGKIKTKKNDYPFYNWRGKYFKIEKIKNLNYINIYKNENGKICGKDNYGNDLYFPKDVECPINHIIIENSNNKYYEGYEEIKLDDYKSIYYTNKKISEKIIIDLKVNPLNYNLNLNLKKTNTICKYLKSINFNELEKEECKSFDYYDLNSYIKIDDWDYKSFLSDSNLKSDSNIYETLNFVGITYFGFDPSSIKDRKKIKTIERNLIVFKIFFILQLICCVLSTILVISFLIMIEGRIFDNNNKCLFFFILFLIIILIIFEITMFLFSLIVRINEIHNFIFAIIYKDKDEDEKNAIDNENIYKFTISLYIIISIALFSLLVAIIKFSFTYFLEKIISERKEVRNLQSNNNENNERIVRAVSKNLNTERLNINEQITNNNNISNNNNNNIIKSNEETDDPKNITVFNTKSENNNIELEKKMEYSEPVDINNNKLKETIECPDPLNINIKKEIKFEKSKLQISESNNIHLYNNIHLCAKCFASEAQVVLGPCGHKCLCQDCYKKQKNLLKKCIICHKNIESVIMKVYDL